MSKFYRVINAHLKPHGFSVVLLSLFLLPMFGSMDLASAERSDLLGHYALSGTTDDGKLSGTGAVFFKNNWVRKDKLQFIYNPIDTQRNCILAQIDETFKLGARANLRSKGILWWKKTADDGQDFEYPLLTKDGKPTGHTLTCVAGQDGKASNKCSMIIRDCSTGKQMTIGLQAEKDDRKIKRTTTLVSEEMKIHCQGVVEQKTPHKAAAFLLSVLEFTSHVDYRSKILQTAGEIYKKSKIKKQIKKDLEGMKLCPDYEALVKQEELKNIKKDNLGLPEELRLANTKTTIARNAYKNSRNKSKRAQLKRKYKKALAEFRRAEREYEYSHMERSGEPFDEVGDDGDGILFNVAQ